MQKPAGLLLLLAASCNETYQDRRESPLPLEAIRYASDQQPQANRIFDPRPIMETDHDVTPLPRSKMTSELDELSWDFFAETPESHIAADSFASGENECFVRGEITAEGDHLFMRQRASDPKCFRDTYQILEQMIAKGTVEGSVDHGSFLEGLLFVQCEEADLSEFDGRSFRLGSFEEMRELDADLKVACQGTTMKQIIQIEAKMTLAASLTQGERHIESYYSKELKFWQANGAEPCVTESTDDGMLHRACQSGLWTNTSKRSVVNGEVERDIQDDVTYILASVEELFAPTDSAFYAEGRMDFVYHGWEGQIIYNGEDEETPYEFHREGTTIEGKLSDFLFGPYSGVGEKDVPSYATPVSLE